MRARTTSRKTVRWIKAAVTMLAVVGTVYGFASGPPAAHTSAPNEANCTQCHTGKVNNGGGSITIEGVPDVYTPGQTYEITVRVQRPDRIDRKSTRLNSS